MGLASALSTALTGLTASETTIDVVGNNLANSNTVGFKASQATFATQFLQTRSLGSKPSAATTGSAGTNPTQIGLGTMVADITPNFNQGTIEISANPMDLAIQGDGFFIAQSNSGEELYTRNGIFTLNSQNQMVTITGQRVLGYDVDDQGQPVEGALIPIRIPLGSEMIAEATDNVFLEGMLSPTGDVATTAEIIETSALGDATYGAPDVTGTTVGVPGEPNIGGVSGTPGVGGLLSDDFTYEYRIVLYDPNTGSEGLPSQPISVPLAVGRNRIDLAGLPTDDGTGVYSQQRIYRNTKANPTDYYLVATQNSDANYADITADDVIEVNPQLDDNLLDGTYTYYLTFVDDNGVESRPSAALETNVASGGVQLRDLPTADSAPTIEDHPGNGWTKRRIYRNVPSIDRSEYRRVAEIDDATTANLTLTDHASDATIFGNAQLDFNGPKIQNNTLLVNVLRRDQDVYESVFEVGTLEFTGKKGGRSLSPRTLEITSTTTVSELVEFMEQALGIHPQNEDPTNPIPVDGGSGSPPGGYVTGGKIQFISNNGVSNALEIDLSGMKLTTTTGTDNLNLPFGSTQSAVGESTVADFIAYDSLGSALSVRITMVMETRDGNSVTYRWFADSPDNEPQDLSTFPPGEIPDVDIAVGTGRVTFDSTGDFLSATNDTVTIDRRNNPAASPLTFDLDFQSISALATPTSILAISRQDGSAAGTLTSFIVGEDGMIRGVFSNGINRQLAQIVLARFANPNGLEQRGQNAYVKGVNSGEPVKGAPGTGGRGTIIAGAVELSNTDIGANLVDLILASTMYRGNTRVITTAQQMLDELLSLRR